MKPVRKEITLSFLFFVIAFTAKVPPPDNFGFAAQLVMMGLFSGLAAGHIGKMIRDQNHK